MPRFLACLLTVSFLFVASLTQAQEDTYEVPAEAKRIEGVPVGKIEGPFKLESNIFPGTVRDYWIYVPSQYDPEKPACSMIVQDGLNRAKGWKLPQIFDNLIHQGDMPVTIGIFVSPGVVPTTKKDAQPRFNRSFEYDSLGDTYARFLIEELLPAVSEKYKLSERATDRAVAGASSGGICAFNAAWERPDQFQRVLSTIGTYVGLRGGNQFPMLVRKTEPKPIRVFLQDGQNDLDIYAGDWWVANQDMLSSLTWAGYEVKHVWGEGGHNGKHAASIMPDALRWLWKNHPDPITVDLSRGAQRRTDVLLPDEGWKLISSGHQLASSPTCNAQGELFFCDPKESRIFRIGSDNKVRLFKDQAGNIQSLGFAPNGHLLAARNNEEIVQFAPNGNEIPLANNIRCSQLLTLPQGFYCISNDSSSIRWLSYDGKITDAGSAGIPVAAMAVTADQAFAHIASAQRQFTLHAMLNESHKLTHRQKFGYLHMPYLKEESGVSAMTTDDQGRIFVASTVGIQILDQLGRVHLILNRPSKTAITGIVFGGAQRDVLYVTAGDQVFARRLNTKGINHPAGPSPLPRPNL